MLTGHPKTRGIVQARWALRHASTRSSSPWETRTRRFAADVLGVEDWSVNRPVFDLAGNLLGIPDILDLRSGLVIESDGAGHREEAAHNDDNAREENLEHHGMTVVRAGAQDHNRARKPKTVRRLRVGYEDAKHRTRRAWTTEKPQWWWHWPPGRRWD